MPQNNEQFTIYCKTCDKDVFLIEDSGFEFHCPTCNEKYTSEDGVMDLVYATEMYNSYKAAKRTKSDYCEYGHYEEGNLFLPACSNERDVDFIRDEERGK